jgi:dTDP-4-dehydrorhamnose reductase
MTAMHTSPHSFLVIGGDGQLGASLSSHLKEAGHQILSTVFFRDPACAEEIFMDLREDVSFWPIPGTFDAAFLCAAVTSMEICRTQPAESWKINVENTLDLARRLSDDGAALFFPSTNLVYDGNLPFRSTTDPVNPLCEYGRQKVETEQGLAALTDRTAIIRFTKIIGPGFALIRNWMADLRQGKTIHPFSDMVLSPVSLRFASEAIIAIMQRESYGFWHISAREDVTYEQVAIYLARRTGVSQGLIEPIKVAQSGLAFETIPEHTTLDTSRLREELGLESPSVWETLDEIFP